MMHSDTTLRLVLDYGDGEIHYAQNKTSNERLEEYAFPLTCSLKLDLQV